MSSPTFDGLGLSETVVRRLARGGITAPFPIQAAVIPDVLAGRDVCGRAPTGSGKTLAFGLPMVSTLTNARSKSPTALVLAPTRELADQIARELRPFAEDAGHDVATVYGGVGYGPQKQRLAKGAELVVACPGRLEDLLQMGAIRLDAVRTVVIDEADQMADMGFLPAVRRIVGLTPADRQVLLFSATLDGPVAKLISDFQRHPVTHEVGERGPDITAARHLFWEGNREERVEHVASVVTQLGSTVVFTRTRHGADRLAKQLGRVGVLAEPIHGGRSQPQRDRALAAFKAGKAHALIATDVAARGVHVDGVAAVVHFDPPADAATYIHRSGRTARAGATGVVVSLIDHTMRHDTRKLQRTIGLEETVTGPDVATLTGGAGHAPRPVTVVDHVTTPAATTTTRAPRPARPRPANGGGNGGSNGNGGGNRSRNGNRNGRNAHGSAGGGSRSGGGGGRRDGGQRQVSGSSSRGSAARAR
jgi:superfamily II DNA/RNA helicase